MTKGLDWYEASVKAAALGDDRMAGAVGHDVRRAALDFVDTLEQTKHEDVFRFAYPSLDAIVGGAAPGAATFLYARTGNGKTTFVTNIMSDELLAGRGVTVIPTESTPREVVGKWACLLLNERYGYWASYDAKRDVAEGRLSKDEYDRRFGLIRDEAGRLQEAFGTGQLNIEGSLHIDSNVVKRAFYKAKQLGHGLVIIDHIDLIRPDPKSRSGSKYDASVDAVDTLLDLLRETRLNALVCSQSDAALVKGTVIQQYDPPTLGNAYNGQHKNHAATHVLGLFRPRLHNLSVDMQREVNERQRPAIDALQPNRMGIIKNKDRNYGDDGRRCILALHNGKLRELTDEEKRDDEAQRHAIHTGGALR
jgi:hypothetical protein